MILLIDNYDSFSYNLYQMIAPYEEVLVKRNDAITLDEIERLKPNAIILSPGPGRPEEAGLCMAIVQRFYETIPILGVCLGHQAIGKAFGARVRAAHELVHGKQRTIELMADSVLFEGIDDLRVGRYHSLCIDDLPSALVCTARCDEEIMAIQHKDYPVYGVQFHPESILTPCGKQLFANFMKGIRQ